MIIITIFNINLNFSDYNFEELLYGFILVWLSWMFPHVIGSHFGCNVFFEVDSILRFRLFASCWPFSLPLCLLVSAMKKTVIKIGGGCLVTDVISRLPPGNKLS
jgi:hypothetical protein